MRWVALFLVLGTAPVFPQNRAVAITFDDLPFVANSEGRPMNELDVHAAASANRKLLNALAHHHVPVTAFVIEKSVELLGKPEGTQILKMWVDRGQDLGNHSYAHLDFSHLDVQQFEDEIIHGESTIVPLMQTANRKVEFFRFPFNHTGNTEAKHAAVQEFLSKRGYRLAPCTIENSDWMFAAAYTRMLTRHDRSSAARLRKDYVTFTGAQIDYFSEMNKDVLGYEPAEIMLLHDNQLNADVINQILALFEQRGYKWVTLSAAEQDPIYRRPDTFVTEYGPMWGYRWAKQLGKKVDGSKEPDPPAWVSAYGSQPAEARRPRSNF